MKTKLMLIAFWVYLCIPIFAMSASIDHEDSAGDSGQSSDDISVLYFETTPEILQIDFSYDAALESPDLREMYVFLDTDADEETGYPLGAECRIHIYHQNFYGDEILTADLLLEDGTAIPLDQVASAWAASFDQYTVQLTAAALGFPTEEARVFVASARDLTGTVGYDRAPDSGWLDPAAGGVSMPFSGNENCQFTLPSDETEVRPAQLTMIRGRMLEGRLHLLLDLAMPVSVGLLNNFMAVDVDLDLDKALFSGFTHMGFDPPSFGVDANISILMGPLVEPMGTLSFKHPDSPLAMNLPTEPSVLEVPVGSVSNDTRLVVGANAIGTTDNQVYLSVPLALLGFPDGDLFLQTSAINMENIAQGSVLPVDGALEVTTSNEPSETKVTVRPPLATVGEEFLAQDPAGDSTWLSGMDGEDIVSIQAARLENGGLMFRVGLAMLEPEDQSNVFLYLDLDNNAATGLPSPAEQGQPLGADIAVSLWVPQSSVIVTQGAETVLGDIGHLVHAALGTQGGHYTVSVPPELLSNIVPEITFAAASSTVYLEPGDPYPEPAGGQFCDFAPDQGVYAFTPPSLSRGTPKP